MSWDISIMKFSQQYKSVAEIPENEKLQILGERTSIHEAVSSIFQNTNWSDPVWGIWKCQSGSVEFNLGEDDSSLSLMLHVRAGLEVVPLIVKLCESNGWQGIDCSTSEFIEKSGSPKAGLEKWSAYRDEVINGNQENISKRLIAIFGAGILIAIGFAYWLYSSYPQGMLLYTPVQGTRPNYTHSSALGFFLATFGLCFLSLLSSLIIFFIGIIANRRWFSFTKQTIILALGFGLLATITMITEKFWP